MHPIRNSQQLREKATELTGPPSSWLSEQPIASNTDKKHPWRNAAGNESSAGQTSFTNSIQVKRSLKRSVAFRACKRNSTNRQSAVEYLSFAESSWNALECMRDMRSAFKSSSSSQAAPIHISVNRLRRAGLSSFFPKSPPGF
jgi:hypothetical protein